MKNANLIRTTLLVALACLPLLAWGLDLGGSLDNTTTGNKLAASSVNMTQSDKISLWLSHNFDDLNSLSIKGNYKFALSNLLQPSFSMGNDMSNTGDIDQLVLALAFPNVFGDKTKLKLWIGRSSFADFSSEIINHKLDGISTEFTFPGLTWKLGVGTSALLFRHSSGLFNTAADLNEIVEWTNMKNGKIGFDAAKAFADPKIVLVNTFSLPRIIDSTNMNIGLVGQVDLGAKQPVAGAKYNAADRIPVDVGYLGLGLNGKIVGSLYYDVYAWLELGYTLSNVSNTYQSSLILSNMDSLRFTLYLTEVANSVLDLGGKIGLGDYNASGQFASSHNSTGMATGFTPLSFRSVANLFNPQLTNLIQADLGYSLKPFSGSDTVMKDFQIELRGLTFLRLMGVNPSNSSTAAPTSEVLVSGATENYLGTEVDLNLSWRPASDVGLSLNTGLFLPNGNVINLKARNIKDPWELMTTFALSLSF